MTENNDDEIVIVAFRCEHETPVAWGSIKYPCAECGSLVWLAPSGQANLPVAKMVVCAECLNQNYEYDQSDIMPLTDKQKAELNEIFGHVPNVDNEKIRHWLKELFKEGEDAT